MTEKERRAAPYEYDLDTTFREVISFRPGHRPGWDVLLSVTRFFSFSLSFSLGFNEGKRIPLPHPSIGYRGRKLTVADRGGAYLKRRQ